jgi:hypothetical protein
MMRAAMILRCHLLLATMLFVGSNAAAQRPKHFIYFGAEHNRILDSAFISNPGIAGAQLRFTWRELEPERGRYDFSGIEAARASLAKHGKRLWIQVQDVSFSERQVVPDYLLNDPAFSGGVMRQYEGESFAGTAARRWDPAVRERFGRLLNAMGREFDGRIEGLNLAETSIGVDNPKHRPADFNDAEYAAGIRAMMSAARAAFPRSHVIVYANFMPGETLPANDRGYLRSVYEHAARIGMGVGGPDILPHRPWQQNHSLPLIANRSSNVIAAMAVQDGNLADKNRKTQARVTVFELLQYATEKLRLDYIFWGTEEPYYTEEVLPHLAKLRSN